MINKTIIFTKRHPDGKEEHISKKESELTPEEVDQIYNDFVFQFETRPGVVQERFVNALVETVNFEMNKAGGEQRKHEQNPGS